MISGQAGARAWVALSLLFAALALAAWWGAPPDALSWRIGRWSTEPWRWWSAAFVHWSAWHLGANLIGCVVVAAFGAVARVTPAASLAWLAAWPLTHLALLVQPALASYGGLSGLLHAGVAIVACQLVVHARGARRAIGAAVGAGLAIKLALEAPWGEATRQVAGWDFAVAPLAHAAGAMAGAACALLASILSIHKRSGEGT